MGNGYTINRREFGNIGDLFKKFLKRHPEEIPKNIINALKTYIFIGVTCKFIAK